MGGGGGEREEKIMVTSNFSFLTKFSNAVFFRFINIQDCEVKGYFYTNLSKA